MRRVLILLIVAACDRSSPTPTTSAPVTPAPAAQAPAPGMKPEVTQEVRAATPKPESDAIPTPNRPLTDGEIAILKPIFRDGIDYAQVRVINNTYAFQPANVYMTPRGHVYAPGNLWRDDFSKASASYRAVFVHELTHVWQHANGMDLVAAGVAEFAKYRGDYEKAYPYTLALGRDLADFGMEQQASIIEDYFTITVDKGSPGRIENRVAAGPERDALYAGTLAKFLANAKYVRQMSPQDIAERHAKSAESGPVGPSNCSEQPKDHEAGHLCAWRFETKHP